MEIPDYYLQRPATKDIYTADFDALYDAIIKSAASNDGPLDISYNLEAPKWQFLCHLADTKDIVLHGSSNDAIDEFEPRQSNDTEEFGNRCAVYAASDGIWPMFFAVVDRERVNSLMNTCFRNCYPDGVTSDPYYYFSIDQDAIPMFPWHEGTIYVLPKEPFEQQARRRVRDRDVEIAQWASLVAVKPIAKLTVAPEDFPFLHEVNGHDSRIVMERVARDPNGFPWRD